MFDCCCYWIHLLELSWRLCVGVVCHRAFIEAVVVLMLMLLTCSVNWQLRLITFLQSTGAVAFVWRTVHSSCVLKLIFILIDFKKMFLSLKEVFMSVDCVVFVETRMLCLLRWNCLWQLVFFSWAERVFSQFLMISLALVETFWRTLMFYLSVCCRGNVIAFGIVDVHFSLILSVCFCCWVISVFWVKNICDQDAF